MASVPWPVDSNVIEFGTDQPLGESLFELGCANYLVVVPGEAERARAGNHCPAIADRLVVSRNRQAVRRNNADVLILSGRAAWSAVRWRNVRHAGHVALRPARRLGFVLAAMACLCQVLFGRMRKPRLVMLSNQHGKSRLLVFGVRRRKSGGARHYIPHALGIGGFLHRLTESGTRHVVLRWFEDLPRLPAGEDLDLLVRDEQLPDVLALLASGPGVQPCDVYSETGLPRSDFRHMPYFPPRVAAQLLAGAVSHRGLCLVPRPKDHFLSLAYHALYHKGPSSGLPESDAQSPRAKGDHDYPRLLSEMAARLSLHVAITRDGLDQYLAEQGWQPPRDMLARLGRHNRWFADRQASRDANAADRGLTVFLLRAEAMRRGGLEKMLPLIEELGFVVLKTRLLEAREQTRAAQQIRGGNWGRGPWGVSGGPPAALIVAYDPHPLPMTFWKQRKFPLADNARVLEKSRIRDEFNRGYPREQHCNAVHSSDNGGEAWEYINLAMPEHAGEIRHALAEWQSRYRTQQPVLGDLTRFGKRAKIELVEHHGKTCVRKTFKPGRERFCQREVLAMRELSRSVPEIPPLLAGDERTVLCPFYDNVLGYERSSGKLLPLDVAKKAIAALAKVYDAGYALIDASPDNLLVDRHEGLKLIDFEFLHRYEQKPATFAQCYDIAGCPASFAGDQPAGGAKNYRRHWQPYIGLSLASLQHDPTWLQHVKRTVYVALHAHRHWPRRLRHAWRQMTARDRQASPALALAMSKAGLAPARRAA